MLDLSAGLFLLIEEYDVDQVLIQLVSTRSNKMKFGFAEKPDWLPLN